MQPLKDYTQDISDIRSMMERSTKFLSLSGWAGIAVGLYALGGVAVARLLFNVDYSAINISHRGELTQDIIYILLIAVVVLIFSAITAIALCYRKASGAGIQLWSPMARRLLVTMAVPMVAGGVLILIVIAQGLVAYIIPLSLIFYGLALYNAGKFTYGEIGTLGLIELVLGLVSAYYIEFSVWLWAAGFGAMHIVYGIYLHYKYESSKS